MHKHESRAHSFTCSVLKAGTTFHRTFINASVDDFIFFKVRTRRNPLLFIKNLSLAIETVPISPKRNCVFVGRKKFLGRQEVSFVLLYAKLNKLLKETNVYKRHLQGLDSPVQVKLCQLARFLRQMPGHSHAL